MIDLGGRNTFDVRLPNSFINNGSITKPLLLFALPCGLVLLGLIKEKLKSKALLFSIIFIVTFTGLISHEEFVVFLIVSLITLIIFRFGFSGYFFAAVTLSICAASICLAVIFPSESQVIREVLGIPFTILLAAFTLICWSIYLLLVRFSNYFRRRLPTTKIKFSRRTKLLIGLSIVALISYLYLFTFVTWSQIPFSDIHAQVTEQGAKIVPWYLYPMRFGVPGLLGMAYLLLYFFKKYERETFVFLIIALVAVIFTPVYNEYRLNRYLMLSAAGLSSLLVYTILNHINYKKPIITGFLIAGVIVSSGMSIIMYQGYIDLALQNPDLRMFMAHRYFPDDISLLNFIHKNIDIKADNVAVPNNFEHHFRRHQPGSLIAEQIEGYVGIPLDNRLTQASSILQTSTLEGLYNLVNFSNTKYIVFPKDYINRALPEIGAFVLNNFPRVYDGPGGIIVSVPSATEENLPSEVSVVLPQKAMADSSNVPTSSKAVNNTETLTYSNLSSLDINSSSDINRAYLSDNNDTLILKAGSSPIDVWHTEFKDPEFEYFEVDLKVNSSHTGQSHGGMVLEYGNETYYVFLRPHSISVYNTVDKEFVRNNDFIRQQDVWYNLKIVSDRNDKSYKIYVDNEYMLSFPKLDFQKVMRVGLRAINTITEFSPIKVGIPLEERFLSSDKNLNFDKHKNYYYPLSERLNGSDELFNSF